MKLGYLGVSFFFVRSGFILVYVYTGREIEKARFWQARLARVYPAYLFSLLVMAPSIPAFVPLLRAMHGSLVIAVTSFPLLLEAWFPRNLLFWNVVAWSLSVEAFFYFVFPFAQRLLERTNTLGLRFWLVGSWASSLAITFAYVALKPDGVEWPTSKDTTLFWLAVIKFNPVVRLPEFLLGMGVGAKFLRDRKRPRRWPIAVGFILLLLGTMFQQRIPYAMMHSGLPSPAFGLLIYGFATLPAPFRFLHSKFMVLLGNASYSLYLLHWFPLAIMTFVLHEDRSPHILLVVSAYVLVMALVSMAVYLSIENPLRECLSRSKSSPLRSSITRIGHQNQRLDRSDFTVS